MKIRNVQTKHTTYKGKQKMKFKYYNPVKIHFCVDFAEALKHIAQREKKILLVTTKRWRKQESKIEQILGKKLAQIIDEITPNPNLQHLQDLSQNMSDFDCIVAFGGGSVIDSAKFFSARNSSLGSHLGNPSTSLHCGARSSVPHSQGEAIIQSTTANTRIDDSMVSNTDSNDLKTPSLAEGARGWVDSTESTSESRENIKKTNALGEVLSSDFKGCANARAKIGLGVCEHSKFGKSTQDARISELPKSKPIYAFPTTSGTSSELTHWATVWDNAAFIKHSLSDEILYPKEAFYDPRLTLSVPRETTIHTALDALSHSFESIWNNNANPISTHHALCAIEIILRDLSSLAENLHSIELRTSIMQASMHAGLAFSNTQTALAHALSYPLTMRFDTPHGLACSFSLPLLLDCLPKKSHAYALLSPFRARLLEVFEALEISPNPKDYGLDSAFIDEIFATLNARAKNGIFDIEGVREALKKRF